MIFYNRPFINIHSAMEKLATSVSGNAGEQIFEQ